MCVYMYVQGACAGMGVCAWGGAWIHLEGYVTVSVQTCPSVQESLLVKLIPIVWGSEFIKKVGSGRNHFKNYTPSQLQPFISIFTM